MNESVIPLPNHAGIGLKPEHVQEALVCQTDSLWCEVHTENYFVAGGQRLAILEQVRERFPLSFHGVGASLGGPNLPDKTHLQQAKALIDRFQPNAVSEHAVWSQAGGHYFADLFPLPRTQEALERLVTGVDCYQTGVGRSILLENPTNYLEFVSELDEPEFLVEVAQRTGCGLLLDVNNLYLSAHNCGMDPIAYIQALPPHLVGEIHIAGHAPDEQHGNKLLIDSHAHTVASGVWQLLDQALDLLGPKPVLLERDANLPPFAELMVERNLADHAIRNAEHRLTTGQRYG